MLDECMTALGWHDAGYNSYNFAPSSWFSHSFAPVLGAGGKGFVGLPFWLLFAASDFLAVFVPSCLFQLEFQR